MNLEPIIGLEIHVQLKTKSKMFCTCDNSGELQPINSCICEICLGHPGTLPVPNKTAIEWSIKTALALNCEISAESKFDRKHYFYPDLPKAYQISQYDQPFGKYGYLDIDGVQIHINRLHLEEDAAKLLHPTGKNYSIVDYNRAGTPLMEIVTEPDIREPRVAANFLRELRSIMRVLDISEADMEKGHLRCDANISLRKVGTNALNPKTEIKNLNSFKAVERALAYEIKRQKLLWEQGHIPKVHETRGWDEAKGITIEQRQKEEAHDYRYFPEPDIPPIKIKNANETVKAKSFFDLDAMRSSLPELPAAKRTRFHNQYKFSFADAAILTRDYELANYVEQVMSEVLEWVESVAQKEEEFDARLAKLTANWLINELAPRVNNNWSDLKITPENFAEFVTLIAENKITSKAGQQILSVMAETGKDPCDVMAEENLGQVGKSDELTEIIDKVIKSSPDAVADFNKGKANALKFLLGAVMRETKGRVDPSTIEKMLKEALNKDA